MNSSDTPKSPKGDFLINLASPPQSPPLEGGAGSLPSERGKSFRML